MIQKTQSLLILADDLTGAADTAARCRDVGLPTEVYLSDDIPTCLPEGAIAFTSDSRYLLPGDAYAKVYALVDALVRQRNQEGGFYWYKKIDSTLRGNIGSELDALVAVIASQTANDQKARPIVFVCPAFPAQKRGLQNGTLIATEIKVEPIHLPTLLQAQSQHQVAAISLSTIRRGAGHLLIVLQHHLHAGADYLVLDALTDTDLRTIRDAAFMLTASPIFSGSAGLARMIAEEMVVDEIMIEQGMKREVNATTNKYPEPRILFVVGSGSQMAQQQRVHLTSLPQVVTIEIGTHDAATETSFFGRSDFGKNALLHLPTPTPGTPLEGPKARALATRLAQLASQLIWGIQPELIVLVGGDTAVSVMTNLGIKRLTVLTELLPGMALMQGIGQADQAYHFVLKSGNHGDVTTLETLGRSYSALRG